MKKKIDKDGRILYQFSHSTAKGGNVYIHKSVLGCVIKDKQELRNVLGLISKKYCLIDPTIKIYDTIFFLFFHMPKSLTPAKLIESIAKNILPFVDWEEEFVFTNVYDLQEKYLRNDLKKWGYDYDEG